MVFEALLSNGYVTRCNRMQFTVVNSTSSVYSQTTCGVPQGSILGPLLFIVYINDIINSSRILNFIMYADDTSITYANSDIDCLVSTLNKELQNVFDWLKANKLFLNIDKTNFIIFQKKRKPISNRISSSLSVSINGTQINRVNTISFLGDQVDQFLTWNDHIDMITQKISRYVGLLYRLKHFFPHSILKKIYSALILPHLFYCNIVWGCANHTKLDRLFKLQKKALRLCSGSHYLAPSAPIFQQLNMLTIFDVHKFQIAIFMYYVKNKMVPNNFIQMFSLNNTLHYYGTRSANQFHRWCFKTDMKKHAIRHAGPRIWNALGTDVTTCTTVTSFKRILKKNMLISYGQ